MTLKVELGFTPSGGAAPFFQLDDEVKGLLNSTDYVLGGEVFADISEFVKSASISRGKSRELDRFNAGSASVVFNNQRRTFDPTYALSPYAGQIEPKRRIRISMDGIIQFEGIVADWNLQYNAGDYSTATAVANDGTEVLSSINLNSYSTTSQLPGARINSVLDAIDWPADKRNIDEGSQMLEADTVSDGTSSFTYLQKVSQSEPGDLFLSKNGSIKFVDRFTVASEDTTELSDDGTGVQYSGISVQFGAELLYNNITVSNSTSSFTATDQESETFYGEIDYQLDTLALDDSLETLANFLLGRYASPEYRFETITVVLTDKTQEQRATLLGLDLGDIVKVTFTPSDIPPAITRFSKVIRLEQTFDNSGSEIITFGFEALTGVVMVLDSPEFGKLDSGYFLGGPYSAWTLNDAIYGRLSAGMTVS